MSRRNLLLLALVALIGVSFPSCGVKKKRQIDSRGRAAQVVAVLRNLQGVELSDDQLAKIEDLATRHSVKISGARVKLGFAADRISEARAKGAKQGKRGQELDAAALAGCTPKEKAYYAEFQRAIYEFRKGVAEVLTAEQREQAGLTQGGDGHWRLRAR